MKASAHHRYNRCPVPCFLHDLLGIVLPLLVGPGMCQRPPAEDTTVRFMSQLTAAVPRAQGFAQCVAYPTAWVV